MSVASEEKQRSEHIQIFHFSSSNVKQRSVVSLVSEEKQQSEHSQIFHFNNSEVKQHSECGQ